MDIMRHDQIPESCFSDWRGNAVQWEEFFKGYGEWERECPCSPEFNLYSQEVLGKFGRGRYVRGFANRNTVRMILDASGMYGRDAYALARMGFEVTLLDARPSIGSIASAA